MSIRLHLGWVAVAFLLSATACSIWLPDLVVQRQLRGFDRPHRIAVAPFYPSRLLSKRAEASGTEAWEAAALVARFVTEAIDKRAVQVIPESDMVIAFEGQGQVIPRQSPELLAERAYSKFGAEAVLLGEVRRYRERDGSAYGSFAPASVEFEVTLYSAPAAEKLWIARFDQTQPSITGNVFTSSRYPAGGTRFLTVAELAQWGAGLVVAEMPVGR